MQEKVVITGMGTVNSIGHSLKETWENIIKGVSGMGPITAFDTSQFLVKVACEVKDFDPAEYLGAREARRRGSFEQFATVAANEAIAQAGLVVDEENAHRVGVIVSSAIGGMNALEESHRLLLEEGPRRINPFAIPMLMPNGAAGMIGIDHGLRGPSFSVASACASGQDAIGLAWMMLRAGIIDVALAGAGEATITPLGIAAFDRVGAMSRRGPDTHTPTPFDVDRDGLVMGEGAAILVLECEGHAQERGAEILAELAGYAATADAHHITAPAENGAGGARAMQAALDIAGLNTEQIDYINAHGTATRLNDVAETRAIKLVFGERAYQVPVSSTKSMTGHMMGATGALETIFCTKAVRENVLPPTINLQNPDPECDLDYVPNEARQQQVNVAISNAFGFGGHNAVLVVRGYN
jgi:3-oxoacyl-[acyl-carrier-protein] synthase II